jgi:hypothetical protein
VFLTFILKQIFFFLLLSLKMADFWPTLQKMVKQENPQQTAENNNQTFNESDFISVYYF